MLEPGARLPEFSLSASDGSTVSRTALLGKRYVLYFYPKDSTPGCTREACAFRDRSARFQTLGVPVFGVSADSLASHLRFAEKYALDFPLLADPERRLVEACGVWVEKSLYGRRYFGIVRCTLLIGTDGRVEKVWAKVSPDTHSDEVLAWLERGPGTESPAPTERRRGRKTAPRSPSTQRPAIAPEAAAVSAGTGHNADRKPPGPRSKGGTAAATTKAPRKPRV